MCLRSSSKKYNIEKKLSVCLATFNGENYIKAQIVSILNQLSIFDELIISDDHSTDNTVNIVREFKDNRIKLIFNNLDKGYTGNFENAINHSSGDIIFLSDQDDVWIDGKVTKMIEVLGGCELAVSNAQFVDKDLNILHQTLFKLRGEKKGFFNNIYKFRYLGACMAFRREILLKLMPFPKNRILCPHDMWIALISEFYFKVETLAEPLILYRRHEKTVSNGGEKNNNSIFLMLSFRLYSLLMVLTRLHR